jgi:hypothetical protein
MMANPQSMTRLPKVAGLSNNIRTAFRITCNSVFIVDKRPQIFFGKLRPSKSIRRIMRQENRQI